MYIDSFIGMGHPIYIINNLIVVNLINPHSQTEDIQIDIDKEDPKPSLYLDLTSTENVGGRNYFKLEW